MNVLVTGATGFIGSILVQALSRDGHNIRCLVRDIARANRIIKLPKVEIITVDITNKSSLIDVAKGVDYVYHAAAVMGHDLPSEEAFIKFRRVNTEGTRNILDEVVRHKSIKKFIYLSSTAAMGLVKVPIVTEETPCNPFTPYQVTKYEGELLVKEYTKKYGLPGVVLRPSMIYGPGFKGDFLTIAKVVKIGIVPKLGFGKNLSPAIYIDDLIDVLVASKDKAISGETYLISSEESYELSRVINIIAKVLNKRVLNVYTPVFVAKIGAWLLEKTLPIIAKRSPVTARNIESTVIDRVFDIRKIKKDIGFKQKISIEEGLKNTVNYYRELNHI